MVSLGVDDQGTRTAAEPTRVLVFADEYSGMLLPIAVFDPDRLAFLKFVYGLAHQVRLAAARSTPKGLQPSLHCGSNSRLRAELRHSSHPSPA
jgi:hypothetical protein